MNCRWYILIVVIHLITMAGTGSAETIVDLLDAVSKQPGVAISELDEQESVLNNKAATDALYPKFSLFGQGEVYNSPTNLRPMPPTEVNVAAGDSLPFSRNILRYGLTMEMPVYAGKIYALRDKLSVLTKKAEITNHINLVTRQAQVVSLNSSFQYLVDLDQAISARIESLEKTRSDVVIKVNNGRNSEAELMKINNLLIELSQQKNELQIRMLDVKQNLKKLTGLMITHPVGMKIDSPIPDSSFIGVRKDELQVAAAEKEKALQQAAYYPVVSLYGTLSGNDGEAYNTNEHIFRSYHYAGLMVKIPLFDKSLSTHKAIAGVQLEKACKQLDNTKIELNALSENLREKEPIIEKSLELAKQSEKNNEQLLKIARVSFDSGRTTTEEYLRYENQVLISQAAVNKAVDQQWQVITQQAVLYGIDLRGVVK